MFSGDQLDGSEVDATHGRTPPKRLLQLSLLATALGLLAGGAAYVLVHLIALLTNVALFHQVSWTLPSLADVPRGPGLVLVAMAGGLAVALLARWSPEIRGHGIPEAMEAVLTQQSRIHPRTAVTKPLSAAIAIGTGGPFGAEGPIIVTGGALGSLVGQVLPVTASERKILLACGAAGGMAATFGTPLAAVVLAIELLLFEFSARAFVPLVVSSALAGGVHAAIFGTGPLFSVPPHDYNGLDKLPLYAALGLAAGLLAVVVTKGLFLVEAGYERLPVSHFWHPVIGGAAFATVGLFVPRALGVGYDAIGDILAGKIAVGALAVLVLAKLAAWWLALASGTSGGTLAPLLLISGGFGSLFGSAVDHLVPAAHVSPGAFALVAMAATFGAAVRATFTAIVFCFELTRDYEAILPLMLASVVAQLVAGALLTESLMTQKLARRGLRVRSDYEADVLASVTVDAVMARDVDTLPATLTIGEARDRFARGGHGAYPLVDDAGRCTGIIARHDLLQSDDDAAEPVATIASRDVVTIAPDATLLVALSRLLDEEIGHLPVVVEGQLVGMCTRTDILRARQRQLDAELRQPGWRPVPRRQPRPAMAGPMNGHPPEGTSSMHAVLVVANQTLGGGELVRAIERCRADGPCMVHILVPATRPHDLYTNLLDAYRGDVPDDDVARASAQSRLDRELAWLRGLGIDADGEVGEPDPLAAIAHVLGRDADRYDEIIISTLPSHLSHWLRIDLPHRAQRAFRLPITHVAGLPPPYDEGPAEDS
jgi:H+/Cl- antiporter ClcA/CBS domain-containing protein